MVLLYSRPRLLNNEIWANADGGVAVQAGGDPVLEDNVIRDHVTGGVAACGVRIRISSAGLATVRPGNVFRGNAGGDVVREVL